MNSNPDGGRQQYYGVYPAIVTDIVDPDNLGRVEVKFPWLGTDGERDVRAWATLLSPYADRDQGFLTLPEKDSQVVVAFEAGNLHRPYIVG
ncbi:MAG: phage baseplate assembly protein V, partial [Pigmentiphaga sp.]